MINFYTSYYANLKNIPKTYLCLGISYICPEWLREYNDEHPNFLFIKNKCLAPSQELLFDIKNNKISEEEYKSRYIHELFGNIINKMGYIDIPQFFKEMSNNIETGCEVQYEGIVFLCYEKPGMFCHRHLLRRLLNFIYKIPCKEFGIDERNVWGFKESDLPPKIKIPLGKPGTTNSLF